MTRAEVESLFTCTVLQWDEFDGETAWYSAVQHGRVIVAESFGLLLAALAPIPQLRLAA